MDTEYLFIAIFGPRTSRNEPIHRHKPRLNVVLSGAQPQRLAQLHPFATGDSCELGLKRLS